MAGYRGPSLGLPHWWQRHPWAALYCGWIVIAGLVAGLSSFWAAEHP